MMLGWSREARILTSVMVDWRSVFVMPSTGICWERRAGRWGKQFRKWTFARFRDLANRERETRRNGGGMQIFVSKITLMMTSRLSLCLRQRYTVPKAPRPTTRIRSYLSILKMSPLLVGFYRKQRISLSHFWFFCLLLWQMFSSKVTLVCSRFQASFFSSDDIMCHYQPCNQCFQREIKSASLAILVLDIMKMYAFLSSYFCCLSFPVFLWDSLRSSPRTLRSPWPP